MYAAKTNFRKLYSFNLKCSHGCNKDEDQRHIFEECELLKSNTNMKMYNYIFEDMVKQKQAISAFILIEETRNHMKIHLSPGGVCSQDLCKFSL